jgi:outer membrane protein assembly factor BamA
VFYGTDVILLQSEARIPLTADKHFSLATFAETGGTRIRGGGIGVDANSYIVNYGQYTWHGDIGAGVRFDIPQLGFRSIRLDYARGTRGGHFSFGIGQSF